MLGYQSNPVFYVLTERGEDAPVKIGKDETWPSRFVQARCHTPRGIQTIATFHPPRGEKVSKWDVEVRRHFASRKLKTRALEWYGVSASEAVEDLRNLLSSFRVECAPTPTIRAEHRYYDDWREIRPKFEKFAWRIFVHQEDSTGRLKASYGALYDTAYLYCPTYNWRPLLLVLGFESPLQSLDGNRIVSNAWNALMGDKHLGLGAISEEVGWLSPAATLGKVSEFLLAQGLCKFALDRPKPNNAPRRDQAMGSQRIAIGGVPSRKWVRIP